MESFIFENLIVWQRAHQFVLSVYRATQHFPDTERFGLVSQFQRAASSITANISEGYKKLSKADKLRFFNISQGSMEECKNYIILSHDLGYISEEEYITLRNLAVESSKLLNAYCSAVVKDSGVKDNIVEI